MTKKEIAEMNEFVHRELAIWMPTTAEAKEEMAESFLKMCGCESERTEFIQKLVSLLCLCHTVDIPHKEDLTKGVCYVLSAVALGKRSCKEAK